MTNDEYLPFEEAFLLAAHPRLVALRAALVDAGIADLVELEVVDHDVSRGLGFQSASKPNEFFVELMLEDGSEHGFDGVSLVLNCSTMASGQIWAPLNYTSDVGMTDPSEIEGRLEFFDAASLCDAILAEWAQFADRPVSERA